MITIQEAKSKKEITEFIKFPFSLYKDNKYWVPPLIADELETFDKTKNPAFENAEAYFFVAKRNEEIVGRIATIINWDEVNNQQKKIVISWQKKENDIEIVFSDNAKGLDSKYKDNPEEIFNLNESSKTDNSAARCC